MGNRYFRSSAGWRDSFRGTVGVAGVASSDELPTGFVAPIETNTQDVINTGIAVVNLEEQPATVALRL